VEAATRSKVVTGLMLIVLGLGLYGLQFLDDLARPLMLTVIGGLLLASYFAGKNYLLLVLGGIVTGLGIGLFGDEPVRWFVVGEFTEIGLAIGFLAIYLIPLVYERRSHWWPLVPSLIFFLLGFEAWRSFRLFVFSSRGWPILLVIIGALILLGALGGRKKKKKS